MMLCNMLTIYIKLLYILSIKLSLPLKKIRFTSTRKLDVFKDNIFTSLSSIFMSSNTLYGIETQI